MGYYISAKKCKGCWQIWEVAFCSVDMSYQGSWERCPNCHSKDITDHPQLVWAIVDPETNEVIEWNEDLLKLHESKEKGKKGVFAKIPRPE